MPVLAPASPAAGRGGPVRRVGSAGLGGPGAIVFVLAVFTLLSVVVLVDNGNRELRRINLVADQYADAWTSGSLQKVDYDALSGPDVTGGDAAQVADRVRTIVHDLDGSGKITPATVTVERGATARSTADPHLASTRLTVTWDLRRVGLTGPGHAWTYQVTLQERQHEGRWRVVWRPESVHPAVRHGIVLRVQRSTAPKASVAGPGGTALPPDGAPDLAKALLGTLAARPTPEQATVDPLRAAGGAAVGVAGLQDLYDQRVTGGPRITVTAGVQQGVKGVVAPPEPLLVAPPGPPTPVRLTLDPRTQAWAETALRAAGSAATLVVARPSTGEVLAVANTAPTVEQGLSARQPPGSLFGLTSYLALLRQGFTAGSPVNCERPFAYPGQGTVFTDAQGPTIDGVRLAAAVEGGCTTALARLAGKVSPVDLQNAAWDLGFATPLTERDRRTPGWIAVADQLGAPAWLGRVHADGSDVGTGGDPDGARAVPDVHRALDLVGAGTVLVSPLSVTRATATVATGQRRALRLVAAPAPTHPDVVKPLDAGATRSLQEVMLASVTESGGSAHALAQVTGSPVAAMAATAGSGTVRTAWVTGYRGDYAFTVLLPAAPAADGTRTALEVARRFVLNVP